MHVLKVTMNVFINSLETATPPYLLQQEQVEDRARRILGGRFSAFDRMSSAFKSSGVERRYSFAPIEWFEQPLDLETRNRLYLEGAKAIFIDVARQALDSAQLTAKDIDTIVTVSSTGIATPTVEALAFEEMRFRNDVQRVPVFGLGCAGGVSGLAIAQQLARGQAGSNVLLVVIEACTLSFRTEKLKKADIISTVLFGDGAAAACLSTEPSGGKTDQPVAMPGSQHLWPATLGIMGWTVDADGLGVVMDKAIPSFVLEHMYMARNKALESASLDLDQVDRHVFHPGGAKVAEAIEKALALGEGTLDAERDILRDYGNMSAPTVLFVLKELLKRNTQGQMLLGALGPGFTASFIPLKTAA